MTDEFILGLREHNVFGYFFTPYIINTTNDEYSKIKEIILFDDITKNPQKFSASQKKIVQQINEYSDNTLAKKFSRDKNQSTSEFISELKPEFIADRIRPYIEKRLLNIVWLAHENKIKIYYKTDRYETLHKEEEIIFKDKSAQVVFNFIRNQEDTRYFLTALYQDKTIKLINKKATILVCDPCYIVINNNLYYFENIDAKKLSPFFTKEYISIQKRAELKYYETFVYNAIKNYKVNATGFKIANVKSHKKAILNLVTDLNNFLCLNLFFHYDNQVFTAATKDESKVEFLNNNNYFIFNKFNRDHEWEQKIRDRITAMQLIEFNKVSYKLNDTFADSQQQNCAMIVWLNQNLIKLQEAEIEITQTQKKNNYYLKEINLDLKITKHRDWFDINAKVILHDKEISFLDVVPNILSHNPIFTMQDGTKIVIPETWFAKYTHLLNVAEMTQSGLRIHKHLFLIFDNIDQIKTLPEIEELLTEFSHRDDDKFLVPKTIKAELRDYQKAGFIWLYTLFLNKLGACLADDMGLGKTLQTITLIAKIIEEKYNVESIKTEIVNTSKQIDLFSQTIEEPNQEDLQIIDKPRQRTIPTLIVVPKSLIFNWNNEFRKFAPHIKILNYVGYQRDILFREVRCYDVIITTYGIVRNDIDSLAKINFFYIILDESQVIKNTNSKLYKTMMELNANHRMVITGTPIENSLLDLWSQMNFINKGLLGSLQFYKDFYINNIENNQEKISVLKKLISPFILRRTKFEVEKDLPPISEQIIYCDMDSEQEQIYETEKSKIRNYLVSMIEDKKINNHTFHILHALMQLRQIANHPKMIMQTSATSGKFEIVTSILQTLISENHKILIFSSFVKHLKIFEDYLNENQIKYSILTGVSNNRQEIIEEFQNNADIQIFLISIKAGGVGLNLTSADYVFILDPWWNPAVENQAISRAHRIGQDKKVIVYKFISRYTIEEKIKRLQEEKSEIAELFINTNNPFKNLNENIILNLFD